MKNFIAKEPALPNSENFGKKIFKTNKKVFRIFRYLPT